MPNPKDKAEVALYNDDNLDIALFSEEDSGLGLDTIGAQDMILPRLALLQATSPVVMDQDNPDGRPGEFYNVTTSVNYGRKITVICLAYWLSRTKWETREIGSEIDCVATDGTVGTKYGDCSTCQFAEWEDKEPPFCTDFKNLLLLIQENDDDKLQDSPFVLFSGKRASIRYVNKFLTSLKMLKRGGRSLPIFASIWSLSSESKKGANGTFFVPTFRRLGLITNDMVDPLRERFEEFSTMKDELTRAAVKANEAGAVVEGEEADAGGNGGKDDPGY